MIGAPLVAARSLFVAATVLMAAHVTLLVLDPRAIFQSNLFILMYPLLGVAVCLLGANTQSPETRPSWLLFGCGLLIAAVGQLGLTYYDFGAQIHTQTRAINSDFFFFAYGIPVMLAMCSRRTDTGLKIFVWLDGAQAFIAAILAYFKLLGPTLIGAIRARDVRRKGSFHDRDRFKAPHNSTPVATLLARG